MAAHCGLQYFSDLVMHVQFGCAHFLELSSAIFSSED